jgi:hypothetical protein
MANIQSPFSSCRSIKSIDNFYDRLVRESPSLVNSLDVINSALSAYVKNVPTGNASLLCIATSALKLCQISLTVNIAKFFGKSILIANYKWLFD